MPIALEYDGDQYPALVGVIVASFAAIERELPIVVAPITQMKQDRDALAICAVLRSFSSQVGVLEALLALRDKTSHDRIIYGYCKVLFKEASKIRNKYAHALYAKGKAMVMQPFHNDLKGQDEWIEMDIHCRKDKHRMSVILGELFAILHQKELPPSLYDKLAPEDR
jgi:hypothetical protein